MMRNQFCHAVPIATAAAMAGDFKKAEVRWEEDPARRVAGCVHACGHQHGWGEGKVTSGQAAECTPFSDPQAFDGLLRIPSCAWCCAGEPARNTRGAYPAYPEKSVAPVCATSVEGRVSKRWLCRSVAQLRSRSGRRGGLRRDKDSGWRTSLRDWRLAPGGNARAARSSARGASRSRARSMPARP